MLMEFASLEYFVILGYAGMLVILWIKAIFFRSLVGKFHNYMNSITNVFVTHAYRWESSEIWDSSFKAFSALCVRYGISFTLLAGIYFTLFFSMTKYRHIIAIIGAIVFVIAFILVLILAIRLHKKFCLDGWWKCSKRDRKHFGFGIL